MKKYIVLMLFVALIIPVTALAKLKAPDVLDKEKIMTDEGLSKYKSIGIKVTKAEDVKYDNVDSEEMLRMKRFIKECEEKLARTIKNDLEDSGVKAFIIDEDGSNADKADMIIDVKINMMNLGSAFSRSFWGMGAGQAGLGVEGELRDAKSKDTLATFSHENTSGLRSGDKWDLVMNETTDLGDKIADFVSKLSK